MSTILFIISSWKGGDEHFLPIRVFRCRNVCIAMFLFFISMLFNSANSLIRIYTKLSTAIDNSQNAEFLGKWAILGCFIGFVISLIMVARKMKFNIIFVIAFLIIAVANALLYFQYQTMGLLTSLVWSVILNFTGLLMLYSLVAVYGMKGLPSRYLATFVFLMILMRNVIAPAVGDSVYANWMNERQRYYVSRLSQNIDGENILANAVFAGTKRVGMAQGLDVLTAEKLSTTSLNGKVTIQATIAAMKDIPGTTVVIIVGFTLVTLLLPYRKSETT